MKIVTVSRKPIAESSATANVVKWEAGALNIDGTRIGSFKSKTPSGFDRYNEKLADHGYRPGTYQQGTPPLPSVEGRWPANLILQHHAGCERVGSTTLPGYSINRFTDGAKPFGNGAGHEYETEVFPEEIAQIWACQEGCPVAELEAQTGVTRSTGGKGAASGLIDNPSVYGKYSGKNKGDTAGGFGDEGTVARYFKQVKSEDGMELPEELWDYLAEMISAPPQCEPVMIVSENLEEVDFAEYEDRSVHAMVTVGNPEKYLKEIDRVLRPGAHLLLIAPEDEPTGHTGACAVEKKFGYEIRDAIAVLNEAGEFHYVAKPSTAEKNDGIAEHKDPNTGKMVKNNHETVKPVGIMVALLQDVPKDAPVIDPFMGSGTTGIACLRTEHDFIGIEQDAEYIKLCDQRIRHWDRAFVAWRGAAIESEADIEEDDGPTSIEDLFGF